MSIVLSILLFLGLICLLLPRATFSKSAFIFNGALTIIITIALSTGVIVSTFWCTCIASFVFTLVSKMRALHLLSRKWLSWAAYAIGAFVCTLLFLINLAITNAFSDFTPNAPTGKYAVGFQQAHLIDKDRAELATDNTSDKRELMAYTWYPANATKGETPLPLFIDQQLSRFVANQFGLPKVLINYINDIPGHSYFNVKVATEEKFPLLVFNHGFGSQAMQNVLLMEHLASHGYIVVSVAHPYQSGLVEFPDGRTTTFNPTGFFDVNETSIPTKLIKQQAKNIQIALSNTDYRKALQRFSNSNKNMNAALNIWVEDTRFVIDYLLNQTIPEFTSIQAQINKEQVGLLGMSYGGATAGMFCLQDDRCQAGLNMDGFQFGEHHFDFTLKVPFMLMNSDKSVEFSELPNGTVLPFELNDFVYQQSMAAVHSITIAGAKHGNFGDMPFLFPAGTHLELFGTIAPTRMNSIMNDYVLAFFDQYLKKQPQPLLNENTQYPEVIELIQRNTSYPSFKEN